MRFVPEGETKAQPVKDQPTYKVGDEIRAVGTFTWDNGGNPILLATGYVREAAAPTGEVAQATQD